MQWLKEVYLQAYVFVFRCSSNI